MAEQDKNPASKIAARTETNFIGYSLLLTFCGWRSGDATQISLADSPILPSTGQGVPAFIIAENTLSS
jgi:hypothetical protein